MRLLLIILLQFLSLSSWAFTYELDEYVLKPSSLRYKALEKSFQHGGLHSIRDQSFTNTPFRFDYAFTSFDWKKSILIKEGLKAPVSKRDKIYQAKELDSLVVNFAFRGSHYVLLATGISAVELKGLLKEIVDLKENARLWKLQMILPFAHAKQCEPMTATAHQLAPTMKHIENTELLKTIGKCGADALQGAYQGAEGTLNFFKALAQNPTQLWKEMKQSFDELKQFALNMQTEVKMALTNLQSLSVEQRLEIACTLTGELLLGAAASLAVGGSQLTKLLPELLLKLKNSAQHLAILGELKRKGFKVPDINASTRRILSCAR